MSLTMHPAEPKVPSWNEMARAIRAFAEEWLDAVDRGTPADCELVRLAARLGTAQDAHSAKSEPAAPEAAAIAVSSDQGPLACGAPLDRLGEALAAMTASRDEIRQHYDEVRDQIIRVSARSSRVTDRLAAAEPLHAAVRRWVVARAEWAKYDQPIEVVNEVLDSSAALDALARSVLGVGEG